MTRMNTKVFVIITKCTTVVIKYQNFVTSLFDLLPYLPLVRMN